MNSKSKSGRGQPMTTTQAHIVGRLVAALRAETGLSQRELAEYSPPLSAGVLARIETGRTVPTIDHLTAIERVFEEPEVLELLGNHSPGRCGWLLGQARTCMRRLSDVKVTVNAGKLPTDALFSRQLDQLLAEQLLRWRTPPRSLHSRIARKLSPPLALQAQ